MTPVANKDLNTWVRLDAAWLHNPKVRRAGLFGRALWIAAVLYAYRQNTDGAISADVLDLLAAEAGLTMEQAQEAASRLMEVDLWDREPDGWHIHDYENCQETSDEREGRRSQDRERQRRRRAKAGTATGVTRDSRVSHGGVHDPDVEVEAELELQERCRVENANLDPSPPPPIGEPPTGGRSQTPDEGFDQFWDAYPKRDGRKVGKAQALAQWRKLRPPDRALALVAVGHYAAERGGPGQLSPEDAQRWLRNKTWAEFAEPPDPAAVAAANGRRPRPSVAERLAALPTNRRGD